MAFGGELSRRSAALQASLFTLLVAGLAALGWLLTRSGALARAGSWLVIVDVVVHAALLLGAVLLAVRASPERWKSVGLGRGPMLSIVGVGVAAAVLAYVANAVSVAVYLVATLPDLGPASLERLGEQKMQALDPLASVPLAVVLPLALLVGFYEEVAFRGFLLSRLNAVTRNVPGGAVIAVLLSSAVFALGHAYQGTLGIVQTGAAGVALAIVALWRKSIWPCIFAHALIDVFGLLALRVIQR